MNGLEKIAESRKNLEREYREKLANLEVSEKFTKEFTERPNIYCFVSTFKNKHTVHFSNVEYNQKLTLDDYRYILNKFPAKKMFEFEVEGVTYNSQKKKFSVLYDIWTEFEHITRKSKLTISYFPTDDDSVQFYLDICVGVVPEKFVNVNRALMSSEMENMEYKNMSPDLLNKIRVNHIMPVQLSKFDNYISYWGGKRRCCNTKTSEEIIKMLLTD